MKSSLQFHIPRLIWTGSEYACQCGRKDSRTSDKCGVENVPDKNGDVRTQSADIDVVALSEIDKKAVIGECKFKNEKIDKGIYKTLLRRGKLLTAKYKVSKYIFFSLSGYTDWFETLSDEDVLLLTLDALYK